MSVCSCLCRWRTSAKEAVTNETGYPTWNFATKEVHFEVVLDVKKGFKLQ